MVAARKVVDHKDRLLGFKYDHLSLGSLKPITSWDEKKKRDVLVGVEHPDHGRLQVSDRFTNSVLGRFGISKSIFTYFPHDEVLARITAVESEKAKVKSDGSEGGKSDIRICIEQGLQMGGYEGRLLGVSSPSKPVLEYATADSILSRFNGENVQYAEGCFTSTHSPRSGDSTLVIGKDAHAPRYMMATPIDGFGRPNIYLSLLRRVCMNGAIGYGTAFKTELAGGDDIQSVMERALDTFDNGEGYDALRKRFTAALTSEASVEEAYKLYKLIARLHHTASFDRSGIFSAFHRLTGDLNGTYGIANFDSLSVKRRRTLPAKCTMYQLMNFASELATHHVVDDQPLAALTLQAFVGTAISDEYDLEHSLGEKPEDVTEFDNGQDFYLSDEDSDSPMMLTAALAEVA